MSEKVIKKQRNVAIELWRFIMAIAIIGFHAGCIIARSCNETTGYFMEVSNWFFGSSETLLVFTVTAGYFMAAHFTKRKNDPAYMSRSAASRAWEYTAARIKTLLPVLIIGYIIAIVVCTSFYYPDYKTQDVLVMIVNSIWEFLGFHAAGLRSTGNEFFNLNGPLWFISGMIIAGYFMYWALCKNEDVFSGFVTPLLAIFFAGWWCFTGTRASQTAWSTFGAQTTSTNGMGGSATDATATIGFNNGIIFIVIGMLIGVMVFYMVRSLSAREFSKGAKAALTVLNVVVSALLLWYILWQPTYFKLERWTVAFLCIALITLSLLNRDYLTAALNNKVTNSIFGYLGSISLYIYMLHYPVVIATLRILGHNTPETIYSFWTVYIPATVATVVLSALVNEIMKRTIMKKK